MSELPEIQLKEQIEESNLTVTLRWSNIGLVIKALCAARKQFDIVKKSAENPLYKDARGKSRKYADLTEIITATSDALAANGLAIIQAPFLADKYAGIVTLLAHESGGWVEATINGCPAYQRLKEGGERFDAQTVGIAFTYLARYGERGMLNLGAEDEDANGLVSESKDKPKPFIPPATKEIIQQASPESELPTADERSSLAARLKALKQDSRLLKNFVEKETGKPWVESSGKALESAVSKLEQANKDGKIQEVLSI